MTGLRGTTDREVQSEKLEQVNDTSARKLLMKILSKNPSERYQSMDEVLRDDYFGFGNSDDRTKPADNESGVAPPEPRLAGFTIPIRIGASESNEVQQQIQNLSTEAH